MVRVLPTGEVVSDDDPRVRQRPSAPRPQAASSSFGQPQAQAGLGDSFATIWNNANDRLRQFGLNSFEVAGYRVDPLHLVIAVLGFVLSGPMMLAIVIAAIVISQSSSDNAAPTPAHAVPSRGADVSPGSSSYFAQGDGPQSSSKPKSSGVFTGSGQRLGG